jgi:hypothetical protein
VVGNINVTVEPLKVQFVISFVYRDLTQSNVWHLMFDTESYQP